MIMTSKSFCAGREEALADTIEIAKNCKDLDELIEALNKSIIEETIELKNTEQYQRPFKKGKVVEKRRMYCLAKKLLKEKVGIEEYRNLLSERIAEFDVEDC